MDVDLHVYDGEGDHAFYGDLTGIPNAHLSGDDLNGPGPETFVEDDNGGRKFTYAACYFGAGSGGGIGAGPTTEGGTPPVTVTLVVNDPDGGSRTVRQTLNAPGDGVVLATSPDGPSVTEFHDCGSGAPPPPPPPPADQDGDGVPDAQDECPTVAAQTPNGCPPPVNHPPIAKPDRFRVNAGDVLNENLLTNDSDPDGDPITAKVTHISFAAREWSGVEDDGSFLYTAGPGTLRTQHKLITYVAVDSKGAESAPVTSEVTLNVPRASRQRPYQRPRRRGGRGARRAQMATAAPPLVGPNQRWARTCFGSGLNSSCYVMLSVRQTALFNQQQPWFARPSWSALRDACSNFGFLPIKLKDCLENIGRSEFNALWNKAAIHNAASFGACLAYRVSVHRTWRHPRSGEWGDPEYDPIRSFVLPWEAGNRQTGWLTWKPSLFHGEVRVPLLCDGHGKVWYQPNVPLQGT